MSNVAKARKDNSAGLVGFDYPEGEPLIILTRTFRAPRALVWKACTEPEHMRRWWGPRDTTNPVCEIDLRVGGRWRVVQRGADGSETPFYGEYLEIVAPEKVVNTFGIEGMFDHRSTVQTLTLTDRDGGTFYQAVTRMPSLEARAGMLASGMEVGARQSMERLEDILQTM